MLSKNSGAKALNKTKNVSTDEGIMSDIVFFSSLLICISLGCYYKKISDAGLKRNYGTGLGILLACVICGQQIFYTAIMIHAPVVFDIHVDFFNLSTF
ncbi:unnamed protein product [Leptidea sinapis]|uniref:Uncharacterized protein n=1 Tax=Leptidea sinapis TaxID=189913 RepID=A0A5E4PVC0_9NEOP|nr:unnamed protein product [Leptidea sinapis]